jgi:hypothetical protein
LFCRELSDNAWSRLLAGGYRDPLVGRDTLIGAVFGVAVIVCHPSIALLWIGQPPVMITNPGSANLGTHLFISKSLSQLDAGFCLTFIALFLLLLFIVVVRRERLAFAILWLLLTFISALIGNVHLKMMIFPALSAFLIVYTIYRYGLLASVSSFFFAHLAIFYSMTTELTAWYAADFLIALVICLGLAVYSFYISLAGQPLFAGKLLEE